LDLKNTSFWQTKLKKHTIKNIVGRNLKKKKSKKNIPIFSFIFFQNSSF